MCCILPVMHSDALLCIPVHLGGKIPDFDERLGAILLVWLCQSTGAEIETALCILESVLPRVPTLLVRRWQALGIRLGNLESGNNLCVRLAATQEGSSETRKLGIWNLGVPLLCLGPKRQEGASETRKLGIWNLGAVPWARTQEGASETRKLGIWNMPRSILESAHSESWNLEFAEEYPGICP